MNETRRLQSDSAAATERIGAELAEDLRPGDVVLVAGELWAGKTTLIRGACRALGVKGPVTSPTFTIGQRYLGKHPISHLDLFRLESLEGEDPGLIDDYLTADAVAFLEWPEAAKPRLESPTFRIAIRHAGGDDRSIEIDG